MRLSRGAPRRRKAARIGTRGRAHSRHDRELSLTLSSEAGNMPFGRNRVPGDIAQDSAVTRELPPCGQLGPGRPHLDKDRADGKTKETIMSDKLENFGKPAVVHAIESPWAPMVAITLLAMLAANSLLAAHPLEELANALPACSSSPQWDAARCRHVVGSATTLFFSDDIGDINEAKRICSGCPMAAPCVQGALDRHEPFGVWGGYLFANGQILAHKRPRGRPPKSRPGPSTTRLSLHLERTNGAAAYEAHNIARRPAGAAPELGFWTAAGSEAPVDWGGAGGGPDAAESSRGTPGT